MTGSASLRPWRDTDARALRLASADPEVARQCGGEAFGSDAAATAFIAANLRFDDSARNWAVVSGGTVVGNVGVTAIEPHHGTGWVSYWLVSAARGLGLASRGVAAATQDAFALGLHRLELGHRTDNPASCGVATRVGFVAEGIERERLRYGDVRFDVETHARLATDPASAVEPLTIESLTP